MKKLRLLLGIFILTGFSTQINAQALVYLPSDWSLEVAWIASDKCVYLASDWTTEVAWVASDGCIYLSSDWTTEVGWIADDGCVYDSSDWTTEVAWIGDREGIERKTLGAFAAVVLYFSEYKLKK